MRLCSLPAARQASRRQGPSSGVSVTLVPQALQASLVGVRRLGTDLSAGQTGSETCSQLYADSRPSLSLPLAGPVH